MKPILYIVIPCYNEEMVLPVTAPLFLEKLSSLIKAHKIHVKSKILFVNGGSTDGTWDVIKFLCKKNNHYLGLSLGRNQGQQAAMLAGLSEAKDNSNITITVDCDGQDDLNAIDEMVEQYKKGFDIVYGVRSSRKTDTWFKRTTAQGFYKVMNWLGVKTVYNHSEYRLLSAKAIEELLKYKEVNLFLRGLVLLLGFKSSCVYFERHKRIEGDTHYSVGKLLGLAFEGITSFSVKPIRLITVLGTLLMLFSFVGIGWAFVSYFQGAAVAGWPSLVCLICFIGGVQLLSLGVIGEYIGKIYLETKARPRFVIGERCHDNIRENF